MTEIKNLCYRYPGGPTVLENVSFYLNPGDFLAILGNNGVGKSTLLKCLNGILKPNSGQVLLQGQDLLKLSGRQIAQRVAFVSQSVPASELTVHDTVMLGRRPYQKWGFTEQDHAIVHDAMDKLEIDDLRGHFVSQLSGGQRQKVMLARAWAQQPELLLLDEPTSALDVKNQYQVLSMVEQFCRLDGLSAVVVIHDLNLALRFCNRFLLLKNGQVYREGGKDILDKQALLEVYGVAGNVLDIDGQSVVMIKD